MNPKKKKPMMQSDNDGDEASSNPVAQTGTTAKTGSFQGSSNAAGGGGRFKQMTASGMSPGLVATIGRKKFGAKAFSKMAAKGKSK